MIKRMNNTDKDFYKYMGRIFGSREVQRKTSDRIFDDNGKEWIMNIEKNIILAVVSVKDSVIKNVYAEDVNVLQEILKEIYAEVSTSTVTKVYQNEYSSAGYEVIEEKKNFLIIKGGKSIE